MNPSLSVIIPVYNVEQYLESCVNSVLNQTHLPDEIVLVDDGSTDRSGMICDFFSEKSDIIHVIHKTNGGLSDARNTGIREAKSDYLLFLDSDDTILPDTIEQFFSVIGQCRPEVIVGNVTSYYSDKCVRKMHTLQNRKLISGPAFLKRELISDSMFYESVQCIYEKAFLVSNKLWFIKGLLHEDQVFTTLVFLKAEKVVPTEINFYNHMIREGSISMQSDQTPNASSLVRICKILEKEVANIEDNQLQTMILDHCVSLYYRAYVDAKLVAYPEIRIDKAYLIKNSFSYKNKLRTLLYCLNQKVFYCVEKVRRGE